MFDTLRNDSEISKLKLFIRQVMSEFSMCEICFDNNTGKYLEK